MRRYISGLVQVLGGAGWQRWEAAALQAVGATLHCVLRRTVDGPSRAVQVDPMKPELKAPGANLLTLRVRYDESLLSFAFNFNLRVLRLGAVIAAGGIAKAGHHLAADPADRPAHAAAAARVVAALAISAGRGVIADKHSTDVEYPPPYAPSFYISRHPDGNSCSISVRVLVINDPPAGREHTHAGSE
jgi:hypothetical protein